MFGSYVLVIFWLKKTRFELNEVLNSFTEFLVLLCLNTSGGYLI